MTQDLRAAAQAVVDARTYGETWEAIRSLRIVLAALAAPSEPDAALAPQDGDQRPGLLEAARIVNSVLDEWAIPAEEKGAEIARRFKHELGARGLAAPSEPDLLPGLKRALEFTSGNDHYRLSKLIARIEKERQS